MYRGNTLTIHNITKNDRGTYYCIADNGVGRGAKRNVGVEVEFAPEVTVGRPRYLQVGVGCLWTGYDLSRGYAIAARTVVV